MRTSDGIRTFLESPLSLDPVDPAPFKGLRPTKAGCCPKQQRKRKACLPPYVPYKSVYEQTDFTKLTERQRRMALKFQTNREHVSRLFLEVHGIYLQTPASKERQSMRKKVQAKPAQRTILRAQKPRTGLHVAEDANTEKRGKSKTGVVQSPARSSVPADYICNKTAERQRRLTGPDNAALAQPVQVLSGKMSRIILRLPYTATIACEQCREDAVDLLQYLNWLISTSLHRDVRLVLELRAALVRLIGRFHCICNHETGLYDVAFEVADEHSS